MIANLYPLGQVIDILMQSRRNEAAANKFFRKLLKPQGFVPRVIITDKLRSYGAAKKKILKGVFHPHQHKLAATEYRETMSQRFESWQEVTRQDIAA